MKSGKPKTIAKPAPSNKLSSAKPPMPAPKAAKGKR